MRAYDVAYFTDGKAIVPKISIGENYKCLTISGKDADRPSVTIFFESRDEMIVFHHLLTKEVQNVL